MDSLDKIIVRLFIKPLAFAGLGVVAPFLLGVWIPLQLSDSRMLAPLGQMVSNAALPVAGTVFLASLAMIAMRAWRLRRWQVWVWCFFFSCSGGVVGVEKL